MGALAVHVFYGTRLLNDNIIMTPKLITHKINTQIIN